MLAPKLGQGSHPGHQLGVGEEEKYPLLLELHNRASSAAAARSCCCPHSPAAPGTLLLCYASRLVWFI